MRCVGEDASTLRRRESNSVVSDDDTSGVEPYWAAESNIGSQ